MHICVKCGKPTNLFPTECDSCFEKDQLRHVTLSVGGTSK